MKKNLFLLPVICGSVLLSSCTLFNFGGFDFDEDTGGGTIDYDNDDTGGGTGGGMSGNTLTLDFSDGYFKDNKVTPYVEDNTTLKTFTFDGITYNDKGCFANTYNSNSFLMMKNKWVDGKVTDTDSFAFIGNNDAYASAIKSIDVFISNQTGACNFYVAFGSSPFTTFNNSGTKHSATSSTASNFTETCNNGSKFFCITAATDVGAYRKNGAISKIVIHF